MTTSPEEATMNDTTTRNPKQALTLIVEAAHAGDRDAVAALLPVVGGAGWKYADPIDATSGIIYADETYVAGCAEMTGERYLELVEREDPGLVIRAAGR
jgi:hypothetical protein